MKFILLALICLNSILSLPLTKETTVRKILNEFESKSKKDLFKVWHLLFNRNYEIASEEAKKRFRIFKANLKYINEFNSQPGKSYKLGLGPFTDLTNEEYREKYLMKPETVKMLYESIKNMKKPFLNDEDDDDLTKRNLQSGPVDWRNFLPPVKNQAQCGSCWAFATVATSESYYNQANPGNVVSLSEENLIDCDTSNGDQGCNGGLPIRALPYVLNNGLATEDAYPYTAQNGQSGTCQTVSNPIRISGTANDVTGQVSTAIQTGSVAISVYAAGQDFQSYTSGVFIANSGQQADHAVTAVGFGTDQGNYYIVRNSWGANWGNQGYIWIAQGGDVDVNPAANIAKSS